MYIHTRGASLGDNSKVSANTDEYSGEWRDTFIFAEHFYKGVSGFLQEMKLVFVSQLSILEQKIAILVHSPTTLVHVFVNMG